MSKVISYLPRISKTRLIPDSRASLWEVFDLAEFLLYLGLGPALAEG
jgi:hypothetical protein